MNRITLCTLAFLLSTQAQAKLVVHEWGTFTSLVGSNGEAQNGMYHEDELLPDFVHNFGDELSSQPSYFFAALPPTNPRPTPPPENPKCHGRPKIPCEFLYDQTITQKMETPVVYFYSDIAQKINFDVSFPGGIISQSYPAPLRSAPEAIPGVELKNGFAHYEVNILKDTVAKPPFVAPSNIYSHARNVASDLIQSDNETEKFIFYRGLGEFKTKLQGTSHAGNLHLMNSGVDAIPQAFLIYTDDQNHGSLIELGKINSKAGLSVSSATIQNLKSTKRSQSEFLKMARGELIQALTNAGLFFDEAKAMVDTWENGYFKTRGLRVLYILGRHEVESILPVKINPHPEQLSRVFVGRIEILLDSDEEQLLSEILKKGRGFDVARLGRLAQPILLRIQEVAKNKGLLSADLSLIIDDLVSRIQ